MGDPSSENVRLGFYFELAIIHYTMTLQSALLPNADILVFSGSAIAF